MSSPRPVSSLSKKSDGPNTLIATAQAEILDLQSLIKKRYRDEILEPIASEEDFSIKLQHIDRLYRQASFDDSLRAATRHLHAYLKTVKERSSPLFWKARTLVYELNDVFDITTEIREAAFTDGHRIVDELRFHSARWIAYRPLATQRKLIRDKILFSACYGNELRRRGELSLALNIFNWLLEFTTNKVKNETLPCYGTRAILSYHVGSTLRSLEQHRKAEAMFSQSLNLLYDRGKILDGKNPEDYTYILRKQAMVVGLGFGWTNMTRGFLGRAENALTTARSMLVTVSDPHLSAYVGLLLGTIRRCRAGSNRDKLIQAIDELQTIRRSFMNYPRHQARVCWELALAKTLIGDFAAAQNDLRVVSDYASREMNRKWQVNVQILQSRIFRRQGKSEKARAVADTAVEMAQSPDCKTVLPLLDALITRGEAFLSLAKESSAKSNYNKALEDFDTALNMVSRKNNGKSDHFANPKIASACILRAAECYAKMENQAAAKKRFETWLRLEPHIEHEWLRELAVEVKGEIDRLSWDFVISAKDVAEWNYTNDVAKLQRWLLTQALRQTNQNYSEAAKLIGVQRATLYQWQNQSLRSEGVRARKASRLNESEERSRKKR